MAINQNRIQQLQTMQKAMDTPTNRDDMAMIGAAKGGLSPVTSLEEAQRAGQMAAQQGAVTGHEAAQAGIQRGQELAPPPIPGGETEELGFMASPTDQLKMNQDVHDVLFTAPPSITGEPPKDSIAVKAIESLLKNAKLDIMGMMQAEELGNLQAASGGGLMRLAAGGEFSGMVPGRGHGMQDNVRMPIMEGRQPVGTLAVSPSEYVVDSHTMAALGNGNPDAGANVMDQVVENVRQRAYGTREQPNEINGLAALNPMIERV